MDFDKSLRKTMATTRKFFGAAIILVYIKNSETPKPQLSAVDCEEGTAKSALLRKIEKKYLKKVFSSGKPLVENCKPLNHEGAPVDTGDGHSLYAPNGAVIESSNGRPEPAAVPLPPDVSTPEPRPLDAMSQSIHFWQGLAVGLGAAIVILFLLAAVLAG